MPAPGERNGVLKLILVVNERSRTRFAFRRNAGANKLSRRINRFELRDWVAELKLEMRFVEYPIAERRYVRKLRGISPFAKDAPRARQYVVGYGICRVGIGEPVEIDACSQ